MITFKFEAIGTGWQIDIQEELSKERESSLYKEIMDRIEVFDKNYSRFRDDSLVTEISKKSGKYEMPKDFEKMYEVYLHAYKVTDGQVTPLIGDTLSDAGYDSKYSLIKKDLKPIKRLEDVLVWNNPILEVLEPVILDFGACGKGYLVDIISEIIEEYGIKKYCVDGSGDMRHRDYESSSIDVGLEHPEDKESVIGIVKLQNESLCGSAINRRKWEDFNHIINPNTQTSPKDILAIWVVARDTMTSDILTTCLFFVSPKELENKYDFDYLIFYSDHSIKSSENFDAVIYK